MDQLLESERNHIDYIIKQPFTSAAQRKGVIYAHLFRWGKLRLYEEMIHYMNMYTIDK